MLLTAVALAAFALCVNADSGSVDLPVATEVKLQGCQSLNLPLCMQRLIKPEQCAFFLNKQALP